jgi:predicted nuclease with TOPRIM domain
VFASAVQEQVEEMKKKEERMEKKMAELTLENRRLTEPLQKARDEVDDLRKQLANYEKDKEMLRVR